MCGCRNKKSKTNLSQPRMPQKNKNSVKPPRPSLNRFRKKLPKM